MAKKGIRSDTMRDRNHYPKQIVKTDGYTFKSLYIDAMKRKKRCSSQ